MENTERTAEFVKANSAWLYEKCKEKPTLLQNLYAKNIPNWLKSIILKRLEKSQTKKYKNFEVKYQRYYNFFFREIAVQESLKKHEQAKTELKAVKPKRKSTAKK